MKAEKSKAKTDVVLHGECGDCRMFSVITCCNLQQIQCSRIPTPFVHKYGKVPQATKMSGFEMLLLFLSSGMNTLLWVLAQVHPMEMAVGSLRGPWCGWWRWPWLSSVSSLAPVEAVQRAHCHVAFLALPSPLTLQRRSLNAAHSGWGEAGRR